MGFFKKYEFLYINCAGNENLSIFILLKPELYEN